MIYIIVLAVILIVVILIFAARKFSEKQQVYRARHSTGLPTTTQDIGEPVTFRGTARDVTDRVFRSGEFRPEELRGEEYDEASSPFSRRNMHYVPAVERTDAEGDPDLPKYGDTRSTTAVRAPERAYNPEAPPRQTFTPASMLSTPRDAPPQYDRAISTPAINRPPAVAT